MSLFAEFLARFCEQAVCKSGAYGERIHTYCGAVQRNPRRKDGLDEIDFAAQREAPPHGLRVERGGCTDLAFPDALQDDERGGGA